VWKQSLRDPSGHSNWSGELDAPPQNKPAAGLKSLFPHADDATLAWAWEMATHPLTGTINCLALNSRGEMSGVTTTSGLSWKIPGRIGDSPIIGAGTYADDRSCAVSATGHGEIFIRAAVAHDIAARVRYGGRSLGEAAREVVFGELAALGGEGGIIAVDRQGGVEMQFNSEGMFRASLVSGGSTRIGIYRD